MWEHSRLEYHCRLISFSSKHLWFSYKASYYVEGALWTEERGGRDDHPVKMGTFSLLLRQCKATYGWFCVF